MDDLKERCYLISIDGGGTKTGVCVYDCRTGNCRCSVCGGGNYKVHGIDTVRERISSCLAELISGCEDIPAQTKYLVMGLSGCDSSYDFRVYAEMMRSLGFASDRMMLCNDSEMIFRSDFDGEGICTVAGTGTIALAFSRSGKVFRAGGWGAPMSDEGSGYWIGAEIVRAYLGWVDGVCEYNDFFARFPVSLNCDSDEEAAAALAAMNPSRIAEWAVPVFESAPENELCRRIIASAAEKTAMLTASVYRKAGFAPESDMVIVESGSLFKNEMYERSFMKNFRKMIPEVNCCFHRSEGIPAENGIRLAKKMAAKLVKTQSCD